MLYYVCIMQTEFIRLPAILTVALLVSAIGCGPAPSLPPHPADRSRYLSPECLASACGRYVYVTAATAADIYVIDAETDKTVAMWPITVNGVQVAPTGLASAPDGSALYVTCGGEGGLLLKFSSADRSDPVGFKSDAPIQSSSVAVGHTPCAPVVSRDGKTVYVANRFNATVSVVDAASMKVRRTISVLREPVAMALGADSKFLFVGNMLPAMAATNDVVAAAVSVVDTSTWAVTNIVLANGSTGLRGATADPTGAYIFFTHTMGRFQLPTTQLERGWMNTAALSVFDGKTGAYVNTVILDEPDLGAANPWGCAVSPDGMTLAIAHAGSREVSLIDANGLETMLALVARGRKVGVSTSADQVPHDLSFLVGLRRRVKLEGDGPRGVTFVGGKKLFVALYFSDLLRELPDVSAADPVSVPVLLNCQEPVSPEDDPVRRGEIVWNDGSVCFQQWQTCATCHPDARIDGLNWDLLNDGMGNPKQTKSLVYCQWTPPTMVTGIRPDMHACNGAGITHIQFAVAPPGAVRALDAYVASLEPVPSPYLVGGKLSKKALRGEQLFHAAQCDVCHSPTVKSPTGMPLFTDRQKHDIGLGTDSEKGRLFDTPTLVECWRSAPYLYDGRAQTMMDVLTTCNPHDTHGVTSKLSKDELEALAEYVLSL